jgi:FAD-dependent urate hydroxylase
VSATERDGRLDVTFADGETQTVDHLLFGTGYQVDIARYPFLTAALTARISRAGGYPLLGPGMESSVPGLHFVGAPAAWSFGPTMRFVSGGWYTSRALVRTIAGPSRLAESAEPAAMPAAAGQAP